MVAPGSNPDDFALPPLRGDLQLLAGAPAADGTPTHLIFDPVRNRYFSIGWLDHEVIRRWRLGRAEAVRADAQQEAGLTLASGHIRAIATFLVRSGLTVRSGRDDAAQMAAADARERGRLTKQLAHSYVFFRIPLVRPDRFLTAAYPVVRPFYSRTAQVLLILLGLVGITLTLRQWDRFWTTFLHFFTLEGILYYALAIMGAKLVHELGHAFTAKRYGCRVPSMGVGFMLLWPILYTDTSDAWRLTDRRKRLAIGAAGVTAELALAVFATLLWNVLPDGPARSVAVLLATVSWVLTLAVNLNPLMRFDGYYLLADLLGEPNLQSRAFALARWRLREFLFALGDPPPEAVRPERRRFMIVYAWVTWIYRLLLFIGIALLVYHLVFKLAGIALLIFELAFLIGRPVLAETSLWWRRRKEMRMNLALLRTLLLLSALVALLCWPWQSTLSLPAVVASETQARLYPPVPARVKAVFVSRGQEVRTGELLVLLEAPDLEQALHQTEIEIEALRRELDGRAAREDILTNVLVLENRLAAKLAEARGYRAQQQALALVAPADGRVTVLAPTLQPGRWLKRDELVVGLIAPQRMRIEAYVEEADLARVATGASGYFVPEDLNRPRIPVTLETIEPAGVDRLRRPSLASVFGGPLAVRRGTAENDLIPEQSLYRLTFQAADGDAAVYRVARGRVHIPAERQSLIGRTARLAAAVFIRESGF